VSTRKKITLRLKAATGSDKRRSPGQKSRARENLDKFVVFSGGDHVPAAVLWRLRTRYNAHQIANCCNAPLNAHQIANYCTTPRCNDSLASRRCSTAEKLICERGIPR
jgi:hypothetical protein